MRLGQITRSVAAHCFNFRWRGVAGKCAAVAAMAAFVCGPSSVAGISPIRPGGAGPVHVLGQPRLLLRNPHLHGANNALAEREAAARRARGEHKFTHWHHRWDFSNWVNLHRGIATIRGTVTDKQGLPVANASVALRHPNNGVFRDLRNKHLTVTSDMGTFTMMGVRSGRYRVRVQVGKDSKFAMVQVHPGDIVVANIRL